MNKTVAICLLIVSVGTVILVSAAAPRWLDDHNEFLKGFVNHELLAILGVILAITLASASQIHLKFNDLEEKRGHDFLQKSRKELEVSAYSLIISFLVAVALVIVKPLCAEHNFGIAFINGMAVWILLFNLLILFDITAGIFSIGPIYSEKIKDLKD
jgi:uncharacterized membrane protein YidH (DUF202 family)